MKIDRKAGKRVALTLGSGGARGYAHIGVIEELEARGYEIVALSGCSMGAVVAGVYAAGQLEAYRDWVCELDYLDVLKLVDVVWSPMGAMRATKVMSKLEELIGERLVEELPLPLTTVATDLLHQREVWFQSGSLLNAIRASIAIPGVITPVEVDGRTLVDGGLLNPLPITPTVFPASSGPTNPSCSPSMSPLLVHSRSRWRIYCRHPRWLMTRVRAAAGRLYGGRPASCSKA